MKLIMFLTYIGVGAVTHLALIGPHIDPTSAVSLAVLLGWPILFGCFAATLLLVVVGILGLLDWIDSRSNRTA